MAEKQPNIVELKWGKPLKEAGWTAIPSTIFLRAVALGLSSVDIHIILILASFQWDADKNPRPSKKAIAKAIGITERAVQRRVAAMEYAKLITRIARKNQNGKAPNEYSFSGLIAAATPLAHEEIKRRAIERAARIQSLGRKKPVKLTLV